MRRFMRCIAIGDSGTAMKRRMEYEVKFKSLHLDAIGTAVFGTLGIIYTDFRRLDIAVFHIFTYIISPRADDRSAAGEDHVVVHRNDFQLRLTVLLQ